MMISGHDIGDDVRGGRAPSSGQALNPSLVLVAGRSEITRVVVSKIVERSGLRSACESPEASVRLLELLAPATVIIDGGADNHECDDLLSAIATARRATGRSFPSVILLSTRNARPEDLSLAHIVDAVVAKPITLDRLQPVVDRIAARAR